MQNINSQLKIKDIIITSSDQKNISQRKNVFIFDKIDNKFKNFIKKKFNISETLFVSIGCVGGFLKKEIIENFFKFNLINFHGTRLPYDAGGGAYSWNILRNDRINNLIAHIIEPGIDKGKNNN